MGSDTASAGHFLVRGGVQHGQYLFQMPPAHSLDQRELVREILIERADADAGNFGGGIGRQALPAASPPEYERRRRGSRRWSPASAPGAGPFASCPPMAECELSHVAPPDEYEQYARFPRPVERNADILGWSRSWLGANKMRRIGSVTCHCFSVSASSPKRLR